MLEGARGWRWFGVGLCCGAGGWGSGLEVPVGCLGVGRRVGVRLGCLV